MEGLRQFLGKYTGLVPPEASKKKIVLSVILEETGITLKEQEVTIRGSEIYLRCHPTVRGEVRLCAHAILQTLHQKHSLRISNIR